MVPYTFLPSTVFPLRAVSSTLMYTVPAVTTRAKHFSQNAFCMSQKRSPSNKIPPAKQLPEPESELLPPLQSSKARVSVRTSMVLHTSLFGAEYRVLRTKTANPTISECTAHIRSKKSNKISSTASESRWLVTWNQKSATCQTFIDSPQDCGQFRGSHGKPESLGLL